MRTMVCHRPAGLNPQICPSQRFLVTGQSPVTAKGGRSKPEAQLRIWHNLLAGIGEPLHLSPARVRWRRPRAGRLDRTQRHMLMTDAVENLRTRIGRDRDLGHGVQKAFKKGFTPP